jgi:light-independent protochlorophyllide reductase subunit B
LPFAPAAREATHAPPEPAVLAQAVPSAVATPEPIDAEAPITPIWADEATRELGKIPFFVRGKARRNTERFALERGLARITRDVLYEAKAHYGR